jgi:hypothetical protein
MSNPQRDPATGRFAPETEAELEAMTDEQLAELAHSELEATIPAPQLQETIKKPDTSKHIEEEPVLHRRVIDIGEGLNPQVFEYESDEELIEQLAEAHAHAQRKIRELDQQRKAQEAASKPEPVKQAATEPTEDDEFLLSQEFFSKPTAAFEKTFEKVVGLPLTEFKTTAQAMVAFQKEKAEKVQKAQHEASVEFITDHPEYIPNEKNGMRITSFINAYCGGDVTVENLEKAYSSLSSGGFLELDNAVETDRTTEPETRSATVRISQPEHGQKEEVIQRRRGSGLSMKGRVSSRPSTTAPTIAELEKMPLDKLEELTRQALNDF